MRPEARGIPACDVHFSMAQPTLATKGLPARLPDLASLLLHLSPPRTLSAAPWTVPEGACDAEDGARLADILLHSQCGIAADLDRRCLLLQLCLSVLDAHARGRCHGAVCPANISVAFGALLTLHGPLRPLHDGAATTQRAAAPPAPVAGSSAASQQGHTLGAQTVPDLRALTEQWRTRSISNLEYILRLNTLAGRSSKDLDSLPMVPWVLDFSCDPRAGLTHTCALRSGCFVYACRAQPTISALIPMLPRFKCLSTLCTCMIPKARSYRVV